MHDGLVLGALGREHHNDLLREADQVRLAREVAQRKPNRLLDGLKNVWLRASHIGR